MWTMSPIYMHTIPPPSMSSVKHQAGGGQEAHTQWYRCLWFSRKAAIVCQHLQTVLGTKRDNPESYEGWWKLCHSLDLKLKN